MDVHRGTDRPLTADSALELRDVHVRFGNVRALDGATFRARPRTVHALLGENGAGKTTLMRVAYGMLRPHAGAIMVDGVPRRLASPADAIHVGIGMVHQHFTLAPAMTVAENVALGASGRAGSAGSRAWRYDRRAAAERVRAIGDRTGLRLEPEARVATLGVSAQQRLEIVKALARDARVLILDEPTAVLSPPETEELLRRLREMADEGRTIVLITHKLREALAVADDVTVLRRGRTALHGAASTLGARELADAMLGAEAGSAEERALVTDEPDEIPSGTAATAGGAAVIAARELDVLDERGVTRIEAASFDVRAGEILGIVGVEGSGHRELLRALAGRLRSVRGSLALPPVLGFIPEDRQHDALALDLSLAENVALRGAGARRGAVGWRTIARHTRALMAQFDVRAPSEHTTARSLSGGNQQKLVLARELDGDPAALVAENPTRGLDVHATAAIHERLRLARNGGMAIVLYSSDVDETLALADRMLVVFDGRVREVARERTAVGNAMIGLT